MVYVYGETAICQNICNRQKNIGENVNLLEIEMKEWKADIIRFTIIIIIVIAGSLVVSNIINRHFERPEYEQEVMFNKHIKAIEGKEFIITIDGKEYKVTVKEGDVAE